MPRPIWSDEDKNMHPICTNASGTLTGLENAFLSRINNIEQLSFDEQTELRELYFKVVVDIPKADR